MNETIALALYFPWLYDAKLALCLGLLWPTIRARFVGADTSVSRQIRIGAPPEPDILPQNTHSQTISTQSNNK